MKVFAKSNSEKNGDGEITKKVDELLKLTDERHALLVAKMRAVDGGDGDAAVQADAALNENRIRIKSAENALGLAVVEHYAKRAEELPKLERDLREKILELGRTAAMHVEIAAKCFEHLARGDVAIQIRRALRPHVEVEGLAADPLSGIRGPGVNQAADHLKANPLPEIIPLKNEVDLLKGFVSGGGNASTAWQRVYNRKYSEKVSPEEHKKRMELEQKVRNFDLSLER